MLNLTNCSEARIQVKRNLCGFMPTTIKTIDFNRGDIFFNFGDIELMDPLVLPKEVLFLKIT